MQGALVSLWQLVSFCGGFCIICIYYTTAIGQQAVLLPMGNLFLVASKKNAEKWG